MTDFPSLETQRLRLRRFENTDAPIVQELLSDPDVIGNLIDITLPYSLDDAHRMITDSHRAFAEESAYVFAVVRQSNDTLVGYCDLELQPQHQRGEIAYWIGRPYWWQGYATEATKSVVRFGFEQLGLNRIFAHVLKTNSASVKVLQKAGLRLEGTFRQGVQKDGVFEDIEFYGLLRDDEQVSV